MMKMKQKINSLRREKIGGVKNLCLGLRKVTQRKERNQKEGGYQEGLESYYQVDLLPPIMLLKSDFKFTSD